MVTRSGSTSARGGAPAGPATAVEVGLKLTPLAGVTASSAYGEPAVADCLIITPALAHGRSVDSGHPGDDFPVAGQRLVHELELVGAAPDIVAGPLDGERARRVRAEPAMPVRRRRHPSTAQAVAVAATAWVTETLSNIAVLNWAPLCEVTNRPICASSPRATVAEPTWSRSAHRSTRNW